MQILPQPSAYHFLGSLDIILVKQVVGVKHFRISQATCLFALILKRNSYKAKNKKQ